MTKKGHNLKCSRVIGLGLLITVVFSLSGCGNGGGEVKGRVSLNGKPAQIEGLLITFLSSDGQIHASPVEDQGLFRSPKIPVGEVRVGFTIAGLAEKKDPSAPMEPGQSQPKNGSSPYDQENLPFLIKYLDPLTSDLTVTIQAGQEVEFNPEILAP